PRSARGESHVWRNVGHAPAHRLTDGWRGATLRAILPPQRGSEMTTVRAALVQCAWTGDKDSMIEKHTTHIADAAKKGAKVMCLQELFYGPYFCQVQHSKHYSYTEK